MPEILRAKSASDIAIEVKKVSKSFKQVRAVIDMDLTIRQGEYVALLGPNGAGKTTLVEIIEGIQKPDAGEIYIKGKTWKGNEESIHRVIGISLQETRFIDKLSARETLTLFASFYGLDKTRVREVISLIGLEDKKDAYVVNLSGGQRQRLTLGIALLNNPEILLLDEPTTGLDPNARRELWSILMKLKRGRKTTMILTTHYMEEAEFLCDRIVIMDHGRVLARGTLEELLADREMGGTVTFSVSGDPTDVINDAGPHLKISWDGVKGTGTVRFRDSAAELPGFMDFLKTRNHTLKSFECRKPTLDDLFIALTGRSLEE